MTQSSVEQVVRICEALKARGIDRITGIGDPPVDWEATMNDPRNDVGPWVREEQP